MWRLFRQQGPTNTLDACTALLQCGGQQHKFAVVLLFLLVCVWVILFYLLLLYVVFQQVGHLHHGAAGQGRRAKNTCVPAAKPLNRGSTGALGGLKTPQQWPLGVSKTGSHRPEPPRSCEAKATLLCCAQIERKHQAAQIEAIYMSMCTTSALGTEG